MQFYKKNLERRWVKKEENNAAVIFSKPGEGMSWEGGEEIAGQETDFPQGDPEQKIMRILYKLSIDRAFCSFRWALVQKSDLNRTCSPLKTRKKRRNSWRRVFKLDSWMNVLHLLGNLNDQTSHTPNWEVLTWLGTPIQENIWSNGTANFVWKQVLNSSFWTSRNTPSQ